ncbi:MAG: YafY family transcriptional regulator, partial [Gammaproteobacteria bacterium]|nr:YafY family transcriptional regulator [Gammaproteobacteria bacterium]
MSRAERLLDLLQLLRHHRFPVSGAVLAAELDISLRTLYRDIASLQAQGAQIDGEAGLGYVLRPGFVLPPLMFSEEEIEALVLGARWVAERADSALGLAARNALTKISAVLPGPLRDELDASALLVGQGEAVVTGNVELSVIRQAIRNERKLIVSYLDLKNMPTQRTLWPFALGYFERVRVLVAWCELRQGFRHFRTDRITALTTSQSRYPRRRQAL